MIAEQRTTLAEVNYLKLDSINNVLEKYPNVNNIFTNEDSIYENAVEEEWKKYPTAYTELKLLPSERERIINSYNPALQGNYRTLCDHSTVKYGIQEFNEKEGTLSQLEVIGRLTTDKVDVLLVKNSDSENKYPHITLAVAKGVSPDESNKEIEENLDDVIPLSDLISVEFRNINTNNHKEFTEADIQKLKEDLSHNQETNSQQQRIATEDYTEKELERIKKGRFPRSYS